MKYANFEDNDGEIFSFYVEDDTDETSTDFQTVLECFLEKWNCEKGKFVGFSNEPKGELG